MPNEIQPGTNIKIEVTRTPVRESAAKTLSRLFAKDRKNQKADRLRTKLRAAQFRDTRRGGRIWVVRPKAPRLVQPGRGDSCQIRATIDVIRDLGSVRAFVKVQPA